MITKDDLEKVGFENYGTDGIFKDYCFYYYKTKLGKTTDLGIAFNLEEGTARLIGDSDEVDNLKELLEYCQTECLDKIKDLSGQIGRLKEEVNDVTDLMFEITNAHRSLK